MNRLKWSRMATDGGQAKSANSRGTDPEGAVKLLLRANYPLANTRSRFKAPRIGRVAAPSAPLRGENEGHPEKFSGLNRG